MVRFYSDEQSIVIQASPDKAFQALTDWSLRSQWRKAIDIKWEGAAQAYVGQKVTFHVKNTLFPYSFSFKVAGLEPNHLLFMEYLDRPLRGRAAVEVRGEGEGSRVTFHWMKVEPVGWTARIFFALGFGKRLHEVQTLETFKMLKTYLEETTPAK